MSNRTAEETLVAASATWSPTEVIVPADAEVVPAPLGDWVHVWIVGDVESDDYTCHVPADAERRSGLTEAWLWFPAPDQDADEFARAEGFAIIQALHP